MSLVLLLTLASLNEDLEALQNILANLPKEAAIAAGRYTKAVDDITANNIRAVEVIRNAREGFITNISVEQFDKDIGASESTILTIQRELVTATRDRINLLSSIEGLNWTRKN